MRFIRRKAKAEEEVLCCPICRERLPDGATECRMCGEPLPAELRERLAEKAARRFAIRG